MTKFQKVFAFILLIISTSLFLYFVPAQTIIDAIGVENVYALMFCISFLGGVSIFSGVPYPLILVGLAGSEVNPVLLGLAAALGVIFGDSTSYLFGSRSSDLLHNYEASKFINTLLAVYDKFPKAMPIIFLVYGAVSPFPNDIITVSAGMRKYSFWKTMLPLGIGNMTFCITLASFADHFIQFL